MKEALRGKRWEPGGVVVVEGKSQDNINHPPHYNASRYEVFDVLQEWAGKGMISYAISNTIKYLARYRLKGDALGDLRKARWYLEKEIEEYSDAKK